MRGADAVLRALEAAGVNTVFTLSGNQIMTIFDAALDTGVRLIHTRHEAAAGFMAEGYARASGRVGVALVTAGAGLGNAISPLITARASQTPLVLLSGDSPVGLDGKGAFQEMPQVAMTEALTKWSKRVTKAEEIGSVLGEAFARASEGQPGPVHVSLPDDVLKAELADTVPPTSQEAKSDTGYPEILKAISEAERPLVLLGPGVPMPALDTGLPILRLESPRGRKDPSLGRWGELWGEVDLVVALGKPVDFSVGFGAEAAWPQARWITVHGSAEEHARAKRNLGSRLESATKGDPARAARMIAGGNLTVSDGWRSRVSDLVAVRPDPGEGLTSASLCDAVATHVAGLDNAIVVSDGGEFGQWAQAMIRVPRRIINGVSGTIGAGVAYAIGARIADPDAEVILLMGDGTAGFHLAEFETAAREGIAFTAVIGNDRRWNAEDALQRRMFGEDRRHSCTLSDARYDLAAEALGAKGMLVERLDDLAGALKSAGEADGPCCIDVRIDGLTAPDV